MNFPEKLLVHRYLPAAWLRVTGEDAAPFLQGQFTNDLRGLEETQSVYGLWLNQKGKVIADSFVIAGAAKGEFWVFSYSSPGQAIRDRLEAYVIADDVQVEDFSGQWEAVSMVGEGVEALGQSGGFQPGYGFRGRRVRRGSWEWVFPPESGATVRERIAGAREISSDEVERLRIADAIPSVPRDIGPEDLPHEGGLDASAISYEKGCYLGQEIIARLRSRGRTRRRLRRLVGPGSAPARGSELWQGGHLSGEMRSAVAGETGADFSGLAMLTEGRYDPALPLSIGSDSPADLRIQAMGA